MNLSRLQHLYSAIKNAPDEGKTRILDTIDNLNETAISGESLLSLAVMDEDYSMVSTLIEAGASPDFPNDFGVTPRMLADLVSSVSIQKALDYAKLFTHPYPSHYFDISRRLSVENFVQRCLRRTNYVTARCLSHSLGILPTDVFTLSPSIEPLGNGEFIDPDLLFLKEPRTFDAKHKSLAAELTSPEMVSVVENRGAAVYAYPVEYRDIKGFALRGTVLETKGLQFLGELELKLFLECPITQYPLTYLDYLWDIMHALAFKVASGEELISGMCYTEVGSKRNLHKAAIVPHLVDTPNPKDRYFMLHLLDIPHDILRSMYKDGHLTNSGTLSPEILGVLMSEELSFVKGDHVRLSVLSAIEKKSQTQSSFRVLYPKAKYLPTTIPDQRSLYRLESLLAFIRGKPQLHPSE